jgi:acetylornithine deacetylase/succinyl-diaminopimelate desuccinylase-like protein
VASGRRRLGAFLNDPLQGALAVLDATPAPRGQELPAARALRDWCARQWPGITWSVEPYSRDGANLVATHGPGPLLYSHLDVSLDDTVSEPITGRSDDPGPLTVTGSAVEGFGLGVARGPAAAALVGFADATRGTLLLAGSGTHRRGGRAAGVEHYLDNHPAPVEAVVAKCGPPTLLWAEPGAAYVQIRLDGSFGAALEPDSADPSGGVATHAGALLGALAGWRRVFLARPVPGGQAGRQMAVGAVHAGSSHKPDLLPARLVVDLYVVTAPGDDHAALGVEAEQHLAAALRSTVLARCRVQVVVESVHDAAATAPDAPIVQAAKQVWAAEFGAAPGPITGWTGSTDGVVLRAHGIDTVRLGPQAARSSTDPRRDILELDQLRSFSRVYARLVGGHSSYITR